MHDYESGEAINDYDLSDYKEKWGYEYYMFHRQDMHKTLLETACGERGEGPPAQLFVNHKAAEIDAEAGTITFENGKTITVDLIVGADGVRVSSHSRILRGGATFLTVLQNSPSFGPRLVWSRCL